MNFIVIITITTLIIAGLFHFYWAFGGKIGLDRAIPTRDGKALIVGFIIFGFAWVAYLLYFKDLSLLSYGKQIVYAGWFLSGMFFVRSIGDFQMVGFFKKIKLTKFAEFDSKYFVPLTLFWSVIFAVLSYQSVNT